MGGKLVGAALRRREDPALVTGRARYTDDRTAPGMAHAAILRSQYGHASIESVDTEAAEAVEGVLGVFTAADVESSGIPGVMRVRGPIEGQVVTDFPVLATDRVRYAGEAVAVVVAEDRYTAHDALDLIDVEYDRLDAVTDVRAATDPDAPTVHEAAPDNVAFDWSFGDADAAEAAMADADHVVEIAHENQRLIGDPMEPRSVLAEYDPEAGLTVTLTTQAPHRAGDYIAGMLGLDADDVRVIAPTVGGGFGIKGQNYPDEVVASWCAMRLARPVKWTATRTEVHITDYQSRDMYVEGALALDDEGTIGGLTLTASVAVGAYYVFVPSLAGNFRSLLSGQYRIPAIGCRAVGTFTNTTPIGPYRGAGRPEAIYFVERLMDEAAAELGVDPVELRRRNQIPPDAFPYETALGSVYDSGDYERTMDRALELVDYEGLRKRQAELRAEDRYLGIGTASFVENTGTRPGMGETGRVVLDDDGGVTAYLGTHDHGQGHRTSFGQVLADEFDLGFGSVDVREGDTDDLPSGVGTFGSRSAAVGASAMVEAARGVKERARELAADHLEVAAEDLEFADGEFFVRGAPERSVHLREVAALEGGSIEALDVYDPPNFAYSFGTHVAVVEVDPESGELAFERYLAVDDCGEVINPMIVEGQVHGGVAQGVAQALCERAVYDDAGTLLTGSLQDYALPKAFDVPEMETEHTVTPCPHNPTGAKGVGESGTIAATPAVVNAVVDALRPFGVTDLRMPITSERVWRAVNGAGD